MKIQGIIYWTATVLLSALFLYSGIMYLTNISVIQGYYQDFNYPTHLVIPLAIAKIIAVIIILWRKNQWLMEWAYAGLFFDMLLACMAHYYAEDPEITLPLAGIIVLLISYFFGKLVRP
jgi:uncharacterized membrane protein YphA (DoxX/SURF4 family)